MTARHLAPILGAILLCILPGSVRPLAAQNEACDEFEASDSGNRDRPSPLDRALELIAFGERCSDAQSLDRALDELVPHLYARHESADAWYAAARARLALARLGVIARPRAHQVIGRSYAEGAMAALRRAVKLDSLYAPAIALLADPDLRRLARTSGYPDRDAIRAAASRRPPDVELLQARAQMETDLGNAALAVEAADQLLAAAADSGLAWLAVARARLLAGELASGYAAWLAGLEAVRTTAAHDAYRADIEWLAAPYEIGAFDSLAGPALAEWGDRFWRRRAAADFRLPGERLAEHESRIRLALSEFPLRRIGREYNKAMPYRSGQLLVDDRGIIHIRHGAPDRILRSGAESLSGCPIQSWLYDDGPDRGLTAHFRPFFSLMISDIRHCSYSDFKLVPGGIWIDGNAMQLAAYDSMYARWMEARHRPVARGRLGRAVVSTEVDRLTLAVTTDAHPLHFERDLDAVVRAYGLAHPSRLLVAFGLPHEGLKRVTLNGRQVFPLRLRLVAVPRHGGMPVELDTTMLYSAGRLLRPDQWIVGQVELPMPPGEFEVRSLIVGADPAAGSFGLQVPVVVPRSEPGVPTISALVLGTTDSELRWQTPAGAFPLSPLNAYSRRNAIELLLMATGLPAGADVPVEVRLTPEEDAARGRIELRFTEHAVNGRIVLRQSISLEGTRPGFHVLTVTVRTADGQTLSHQQRLGISP